MSSNDYRHALPKCLVFMPPIPKGLRSKAQGCRVRPRLPWVNGSKPFSTATRLRTIARSIPHIFLIPIDFVLAQKRAKFVLKSNLTVMLLLFRDVLLHLVEIRL